MHPLAPSDPDRIGPHRILARLGAGGMGEVYLARTPDGQLTALKATRAELAQDQEFRIRFAREVRTAQRVRGPFTPAVLDADPNASTPWMATEYVPGPTLKKAVRDNGPFPEPSLRVLTLGLARALQAIHAAGLMHRDLKPSNVLLSPRGPQVIDFGIARAVEGTVLTKTGQSFGTPAYTSPEQVMGEETGPASDVFSLAGVVVHAATGRAPFGNGRAAEILPRVVSLEPDLSGVPESLRPLLTRCLAKDPAERPSSDEIVHELSAFPLPTAEHGWLPAEVDRSIDAYRQEVRRAVDDTDGPSGNPALSEPSRRRRSASLLAAGAGAVALILATGVTLVVTSPWDQDEASESEEGSGTPGEGSDTPDEELEPGLGGFVSQVEFTPDGSGVYVAAEELTLWDWESGELLHHFTPKPSSFHLADDGTMAAPYADAVAIFDPERRPLDHFSLSEEEQDDVDVSRIEEYGSVAISPDGSLVSLVIFQAGNEQRLYLWNRVEDTIVYSHDLEYTTSETGFSPDGGYLKIVHQGHPRITLHETDTYEEVARWVEEPDENDDGTQAWAPESAFSPTEPLLAVEEVEGSISLYDYEKDEVVGKISTDRRIRRLAFSADGRTLYSAGSATSFPGPAGGGAWDVASGDELTAGDTLLVQQVSPHPTGEVLATFAKDTLLLLDPETFDVINEIG
ncbi:WD40 repeat domain-containing serine/threonine protein kinase [Nocardiopsis alba]|uniref:WD40 repeat domain-containing serine/threonine protein kinase n=1 Tax=Nocardiopsis alba TaxID=53437 RepID=UPI0033B5D4B5